MRKTLSGSLSVGVAYALMLVLAAPAATPLLAQNPQEPYAQAQPASFSADQLDNLVAPIALYPDPLLAQVLLASTFPDQIVNAAQYVRTNGTVGIDGQYWDVSVKAVAHYPTVLNMMDQRIDWTTTLGQAYAQQSTDVMQAVQHMRQLARAQGNLVDTPQQQIAYTDGNICIWPAQARYLYVPVYDPTVVYFRPVFMRPGFHAYFSFGVGYPIGAWLMYDWDWPARRIIYTGWSGGGWIARSRPFISFTGIYLNTAYRHVRYDRDVLFRDPDYGRVRVYRGLGHDVTFVNHRRGRGQGYTPGRYAVPRGTDGHGVMTPGGYRQPQSGSATAGRRMPAPRGVQTPRRMPASAAPQSHARTAQPRRAPSAPAPMIEPRRTQPARPVVRSRPYVLERPAPQARARSPQPYVRSVPRAYVRSVPQPRARAPQPYVRAVPRTYVRPQPRPSVRPQSRPSVRSAPPRARAPRESRPARSAPRTAHRRGHGNN